MPETEHRPSLTVVAASEATVSEKPPNRPLHHRPLTAARNLMQPHGVARSMTTTSQTTAVAERRPCLPGWSLALRRYATHLVFHLLPRYGRPRNPFDAEHAITL